MEIEFLEIFSRDLDKVSNTSVKKAINRIIAIIQNAKTITKVPNIKKLTSYRSAYRVRIGDYRLDLFVDDNIVQLARIVHRKDIYKVFP